MTTAPVLVFSKEEYPTELTVDTSNLACGAVLAQLQEQYSSAIFFCSSKFNQVEKNLSTTGREYLGMIYATEKWRLSLLGRDVTVITVHASLC